MVEGMSDRIHQRHNYFKKVEYTVNHDGGAQGKTYKGFQLQQNTVG